jgi:hypothetical protein
MLYDLRVYICKPGSLKKQLQLYADNGFKTQCQHLGNPVFFLQTETGDVNCYQHMWGFEDAADRAKKRQALLQDPAWQAYLAKSAEAGHLMSQSNSLLVPTPFMTA